jgi:2-polyprenyl-3-methyl-5-hydroxy-6-metoxy-1,4-benzoquinol methylase
MSSSSRDLEYIGSELELFAEAVNWRAYWQQQAAPFLGRRVLEVGAGIGTVTRDLCRSPVDYWVALEPDRVMASHLAADRQTGVLPAMCEPRHGTTETLGPRECFDTVLYIDVLEHIEDDQTEVARVVQHLTPGGHLVVLAPAHQALYTPFDAAIGHFRRYGMARLLTVGTAGMRVCRARYLDSVGLLASLGNRLLLRSAQPNPRQIGLWDRLMVRQSRRLDPLFGYRLGKSVLVVWRKP